MNAENMLGQEDQKLRVCQVRKLKNYGYARLGFLEANLLQMLSVCSVRQIIVEGTPGQAYQILRVPGQEDQILRDPKSCAK